MAGSYLHAVTDSGKLRHIENMSIATENAGDAYETIEEMYGMIWYLAQGKLDLVEDARENYNLGIIMSPGLEQL